MAKISIISDIHIKSSDDLGSKLLFSFCNNSLVKNSDYVFFLGDVFDLFIATKNEFFNKFSKELSLIYQLCNDVEKVYYVEGNHDLFFLNHAKKNEILFSKKDILLDLNSKKILLTHGDFLNNNDKSYHVYRKFLQTEVAFFLANRVFPYSMFNYFGPKASDHSRSSSKKYFDSNKTKELFRRGSENIFSSGIDIVFAGHSHIKDFWELDGKIYVNNGFAQTEKTFVYYDETGVRFIPLIL